MRIAFVSRAVSLALVAVAFGAWLGAVPARGSAPACAKPLVALPVRLPAPVAITTPCALYTVSRSGRTTAAARSRQPAGVSWMQIAGAGAPVVQHGGRIAILRGGRELWQSRGRFRAAGVFATIGPEAVAFGDESFRRGRSSERLYIAPLGGRERLVAVGEQPLGWTKGGRLLSWRFRRGAFAVYLRGPGGALLARVGAGCASCASSRRAGPCSRSRAPACSSATAAVGDGSPTCAGSGSVGAPRSSRSAGV